jgi:hypothetical protein
MKTSQIEKFIWQTPGNQVTSILSTLGVELRQVIDRPEWIIAILSENPGNTGVSVTNGFEFFATKLFEQRMRGVFKPGDILWAEHYPPDEFRLDDEYCLVQLQWDGRKFFNPKWAPIHKDDFKRMALDVPENLLVN